MERQDIIRQLKNKRPQLPTRLNYEKELDSIAQRATEEKDKEHLSIISQECNIRQKFKAFKKVIDSNDEKEKARREFVVDHLTAFHIKEYIFGQTENKPVLMNTLKRLYQLKPYQADLLAKVIEQVQLKSYTECRYLLQVLEMMLKQGQVKLPPPEQWLKGLHQIPQMLKKEFEEGRDKVMNESFKVKWLEHLVDVLRSLGHIVRIFTVNPQTKAALVKDLTLLISQHRILTKQVMTHLYMLLLLINPDEPKPSNDNQICLIHYLHAQNVVLGVNTLPQLINLLPAIKQTEHKCQFVPILLKAFESHYDKYEDKANIFDQVVIIFEVGRTVYGYLEHILGYIMKDSKASWSLQGNHIRKIFVTSVALKNGVSTQFIFNQWKTLIKDLISEAGNMIIPYAASCAESLLTKLYKEHKEDWESWSTTWMPDYKECLMSGDRAQIRGVIEFINPILISISPQPALLKQMVQLSQDPAHRDHLTIGVISLLKCYKQLGLIVADNQKRIFTHSKDDKLVFQADQIRHFLLSNESNVALKALQFLTVTRKGADPIQALQLELIISFYQNSLKTSLPEYRKNYLAATKKMFERLRAAYQHELTKTPEQLLAKNKRYKQKAYYEEFKLFMRQLIASCLDNIFPQVIFELANPALEILLMITSFFGRDKNEVKKGQVLQTSHLLKELGFFSETNFINILGCLQSSYESVRLLAHQILRLFYDLPDPQLLRRLWDESLSNANKLTIKSYENACRILALVSQTYPELLDLPKKYPIPELNICQFFLETIQQRYAIFKEQFASQQQSYYQNLIHGMLTVFSFTFDNLATSIRANSAHFQPYSQAIKQFLTQFFDQLNQIILFSVEISSLNISTVVLDSLPQSQTDKKYKVDCRGHFLEETGKNVGSFFNSPALLTSMENEDQGVENMLVVSFYLLTREAGLVFQSIGNLVATQTSNQYMPSQPLAQLVNTYFYALINLKHMGSVDRISTGLGKMAKVIFDNEDKQLSQLPNALMDKLLVNLKEGNFTNILRRSAGVPYAFTCLLKSQSLGRRQTIKKTVTALLDLSNKTGQEFIDLRIHSLNILKKLFQDGDLKSEMDFYLSPAFISSIEGFTSQEWGVRNSSLMLFAVLANRTLGIKTSYNLLEFFHKCPDLLDFVSGALKGSQLNTMYPPLYPIVLLFSRLLPFDLKGMHLQRGQLNLKEVRKDRLLQLLPLIEEAGLNSNYMGRVMAAKAVLPFMQIKKIIPYCLSIIENSGPIKSNNLLHYKLVTCLQLFTSLQDIAKSHHYHPHIDQQIASRMVASLKELSRLVKRKQAPVVAQLQYKIAEHIIEHYGDKIKHQDGFNQAVESWLKHTSTALKQYLSYPNLIIPMNMGNSMAVKQCVKLHARLTQAQPQHYQDFMQFLKSSVESDPAFLTKADTEVVEHYLATILSALQQSVKNVELQQRIGEIVAKMHLNMTGSDGILIKVIEIRRALRLRADEQLLDQLVQLEHKTNNHFLKIAIFKYIQTVDIDNPHLLTLLRSFSQPDQLEHLRECCVEYFEECLQVQSKHHIVCIRLLEDEEYVLRSEMARVLALKLKMPPLNEQVMKNSLLEKLSVNDFGRLLSEASDYEIKRKNHVQERIFSYDKPNKYRSDISNIIYCLQHNPSLIEHKKQLPQLIEQQMVKHQLKTEIEREALKSYGKDVINRTEYQFETLVRLFLQQVQQEQASEHIRESFLSHPKLRQVYPLYRTE